MVRTGFVCCSLAVLACLGPASAQSPADKLDRVLDKASADRLLRSAIGVTRLGTPIPCLLAKDDLDLETSQTRILLVGGLDGSASSVDATLAGLNWFHTAKEAESLRPRYTLSAVVCANPDAWASGKGPANGSGGDPTRGYPPKGEAYASKTDPEAAYLWRWVGVHAPDLVVEVRAADMFRCLIPASQHGPLQQLARSWKGAGTYPDSDHLVAQLVRSAPAGTGLVPALCLHVPRGDAESSLRNLFAQLKQARFLGPSPARAELQARLSRVPLQVARQLSPRYGKELKQITYINALPFVARLALGDLLKQPAQREDVERVVAPFLAEKRPTITGKEGGAGLAGFLVFGELARRTGEKKYLELARAAADVGFDRAGRPREAFPGHSEMSDAVFMACPLLAQVGRLTGDAKYFETCRRHLAFMRKLCVRDDGLYRHSPLDQAAWGRGNGFPALGLALSLSDIPEDFAAREEMLRAFREQMAALRKHQDPTGAWHQVVDVPGSYRELTATCMITFAMARGVRLGWLERKEYEPAIRRGWYAVRTRVAADGGLVDVCTGTGKQKDLRAYLDRPAILGPDPRGGAMALMVAVEVMAFDAWSKP